MKISWQNVAEIAIGVFAGALVVAVLYGLFNSWLEEQGAKILS